jgi:hypothetical protein
MEYTTELVGADRIRVNTLDPEVIEQLAADPDAEVVGESGERKQFELAKNAFELHFPRA